MEEMATTLKALRKGNLVPQTYNDRDEIKRACRKGKIFACKTHIFILIYGIILLVLGVGTVFLGVNILLTGIGFSDWNIISGAPMAFVPGVILIVPGALCLKAFWRNFLLIGPQGILIRNTRIFLPWDQILNVDWQGKPKTGIKINTKGCLLDRTIFDYSFSPIDVLPNGGIKGLFEVIDVYFQWFRAHRNTVSIPPVHSPVSCSVLYRLFCDHFFTFIATSGGKFD